MHQYYYETDFLATLLFVLFVCAVFCIMIRTESIDREKKEKSNAVKRHTRNYRNR